MPNPHENTREDTISDIMEAIDELVLEYQDETKVLEIEYPRIVEKTGIPRSTMYNQSALEAVDYRYDSCEKVRWKGFFRINIEGWIKERGLEEDVEKKATVEEEIEGEK